MANNRIRRINIPIPNPALAEWLVGDECKAQVTRVTQEIFAIYQNTLPVRTGNLRAHAKWDVQLDGWDAKQDRWFGYVYNDALSYRKQRGRYYAQMIEYGKPSRGIPGQGQLRRAAAIVAGGLGAPGGIALPPGITRDPRIRGSSQLRGPGGRFISNPLISTTSRSRRSASTSSSRRRRKGS